MKILWIFFLCSTFSSADAMDMITLEKYDVINTWFLEATRNRNHDVVKLFLKRGKDINVQDERGWTAIAIAARAGFEDIVALLLEHKVDLSVKTVEGWTPLMAAAEKDNEKIIQLLLEHGADPNVQDNDGWTPLMQATLWGRKNIVALLLAAGANMMICNNSGQTASSICNTICTGEVAQTIGAMFIKKQQEKEAGVLCMLEKFHADNCCWLSLLPRDLQLLLVQLIIRSDEYIWKKLEKI